MTVNLYLFRHGETNENLAGDIILGRADESELSERGVRQAQALGLRLAEEGIYFDKISSSSARRAAMTADIVSNIIGFRKENILRFDKLLEISHGEWEGKRKSVLYTEEVIKAMRDDSYNWAAPSGESQKMVGRRALNWIEENVIGLAERDITAGMFSHGYTIKCIIQGIMDWDPDLTYRVVIDNCSITQVKYVGENGKHPGWHLNRVNDHSHLRNIGLHNPDYAK